MNATDFKPLIIRRHCLNTYLRPSNPPIFTSRTYCIVSILEHRHPLKDPSQSEHATENHPDRVSQQIELGDNGMLKSLTSCSSSTSITIT
jgi:hypothetical protein